MDKAGANLVRTEGKTWRPRIRCLRFESATCPAFHEYEKENK